MCAHTLQGIEGATADLVSQIEVQRRGEHLLEHELVHVVVVDVRPQQLAVLKNLHRAHTRGMLAGSFACAGACMYEGTQP